jgi:ribosomal protein S18 acetylase RimI-like enzyme
LSKKEFKPIQLDLHKAVCIKFREDSFVVSFGDAQKFYGSDGKGAEQYLDWLNSKLEKDPESAVHYWVDNQIIGQIEFGFVKNDPSCGYINLYYLIPTARGIGLGSDLDKYAVDFFRKRKVRKLRLSVSPNNFLAMAFYKKMGWVDLGPREDHPEVNLMEKLI